MPVFLFTGPEAGQKKAAVQDVKERLRKKAGAVEEFSFYAYETETAKVLMLLQNESLFAAARFVVLHNAELIKKKDDVEALCRWMDEGAAGLSTLVLESAENSLDKRLSAKAPRDNQRVFWELRPEQKEAWLRAFFEKAGYRAAPDAITAILSLLDNDTETLGAECSRFFSCFPPDHVITAEDADALLSHNREESAFSLFQALTLPLRAPERFEAALAVLQKIRGTKEGSPQGIIPGLAWCFRRIADWRALCADNPSPSPFDCKRAGFPQAAQGQYRNAARIWTAEQAAQCLALLAASDADARSSGAGLHECILETMLYALVFKKGAPLDAAAF